MTTKEIINTVKKGVEKLGSKESLAGAIGVTSLSVDHWLKGKSCPMANNYLEIVKIINDNRRKSNKTKKENVSEL